MQRFRRVALRCTPLFRGDSLSRMAAIGMILPDNKAYGARPIRKAVLAQMF